MTTATTPTIPGARAGYGNLPPLPEPWSAASTIKCTACGRPYKPAIPAGIAAPLRWGAAPSPACECGNNEWRGTLGEGQVPTQYTADQMRAYARAAMLAAAPAVSAPAWDGEGVAMNLAAAAMDAGEWLALIERLHSAGRWPFSEPDSLAKLQGCRASLAAQLAAFPAPVTGDAA